MREGAADFASNSFRIRLGPTALVDEVGDEEERCMHIRGLELYGTIMPPWRLD